MLVKIHAIYYEGYLIETQQKGTQLNDIRGGGGIKLEVPMVCAGIAGKQTS